MTAKAFLGQAYRLDQQITNKISTLDALNDLAFKTTATMSGMPGSPNRDKQTMADTIDKIIDLQEDINRDIDRLVDLKRTMYEAFANIDNIDYRLILESRYLCNKSWPEIAVDMDYNLRHLYRMHDSALMEAEKFLPLH